MFTRLYIKIKFSLTTAVLLLQILVSPNCIAQQTTDVDEIIREAFQTQISTLVLLTGQPDIGIGRLKIGKDNPVRFAALQVPFKKEYKQSNNDLISLHGMLGASKAVEKVDFGVPVPDVSKYNSYLVNIGVGYRFNYTESFYLWPKLTASYATIKNRHQYNSQFSIDNFRPLVEGLATNWDIDVLSINPSLEAKYSQTVGDYKYSVKSFANLSWNKTTNVDIELHRLKTISNFWMNSFFVGKFIDWEISGKPVFLEAELSRIELFEDVDRALGTSYINRVGGRVLFNTKSKIDWFKKISFNFGYSYGGDFESINVGFSL